MPTASTLPAPSSAISLTTPAWSTDTSLCIDNKNRLPLMHRDRGDRGADQVAPACSACFLWYRAPPSQAQGNASTASEIGYQDGPRCIGTVAMAPAVPTTSPTTPRITAWRIGLRGASLAAM